MSPPAAANDLLRVGQGPSTAASTAQQSAHQQVPDYQIRILIFVTRLAFWLLPILDYIDFFKGWVEGTVFGPKSPAVREKIATDAVLVTGASTGIGYDAAIALAKRGIVVFAGVRQQKDLDRLLDLSISTLVPIQLDVASPQSIRTAVSVVAATLAQRGGTTQLVGIVNNAGVLTTGALADAVRDTTEGVFDVNVHGALAVTQAFLPLIRQHGRGGRISLVSSIAAKATVPHNGVYSASKKAAEGLFEGLRLELASEGIHVSIIRPGCIATPIWNKRNSDDRDSRGFDVLADAMSTHGGIPAYHVTRSIKHALTAQYPLHYYTVGLDARMIIKLTEIVPPRLFDFLIARSFLKIE
ncbi:hypothetical protein BCR44DRAFT_55539 [Catenaria anguillulae PL171]|uniref:Uncharacterized protein n=1 Tax=Catenaria anguillulae PL171 TaxID=765915 RepID=A0A1Y2HNM4_9FUNG|nr:hypothetical protein BCR44DRAFT_55539 [Catenaria anguillulae PL171]